MIECGVLTGDQSGGIMHLIGAACGYSQHGGCPLIRNIVPVAFYLLGLVAVVVAMFGRRQNRLRLVSVAVSFWFLGFLLISCQVSPSGTVPEPSPTAVTAGTPAATATAPGSSVSPLPTPTGTPTQVLQPTPMADAGRVAFHSERTGNFEIWTMQGDGLDLRQLTSETTRNVEPAWSPDGERIAFASARDDPDNLQLYQMNTDGSDQRSIFSDTQPYDNGSPRWSPDGQRIVYQSNREVQFDIYTVKADGTDERRLTDHPRNDSMPDWSPDGSKVVFVSDREGPDTLYIMDADGSNQRSLLPHSDWRNYRPRWSPDGKEILFISERSGIPLVFVVQSDGGEPRSIGSLEQRKVYPAWAFGASKVLFSGEVSATNWDIFLVDQDGANLVTLTIDPAYDRYPDWTP